MFSIEGTYTFCITNFTVGVKLSSGFLKSYLSHLIIFPKQLLKKKKEVVSTLVLSKSPLHFSFFLLDFKNSIDIIFLIFGLVFFLL